MLQQMYPFWAAIVANLTAQLLKPVIRYIRTRDWDWHLALESGGFPSSHSSTVTALSISIGLSEGFDSALFAITCVFSFIVVYDAANVRYYAGKNIQLTKQLISDLEEMKGLKFSDPIYQERLKSVLGHKYVEVIGGIVLGAILPLLLYPLFYS